MKKFLLTLLGVLIGLPIYAQDFEYPYEGQTLKYTVISETDKTVKVKDGTYNYASTTVSGELKIPSVVVNGDVEYTVTEIGDRAFNKCSGMTEVTIPNSVQTIGFYAFSKCTALTSLEIPNSVTLINQYAFENCTGLTSVTIGNSVRTIESGAFKSCTGLISVFIPKSVTLIRDNSFQYCVLKKGAYPNTIPDPFRSSYAIAYDPEASVIEDGVLYSAEKKEILFVPHTLEGEFTVPSTVESIGKFSFRGCTSLTSVSFPDGLQTIDEYAFSGCTSLTSVSFPEGLQTIDRSAFFDCTGLTSVSFPDGLQTIDEYAFSDCTGLTSVSFPDGLQTIDRYAFRGCTSLTSVSFPDGLQTIDEYAFRDCTGLKSVKVNSLVPIKIDDFSFWGCYETAILEVPAQSAYSYLLTNWSKFQNISLSGTDKTVRTYSDGVLNYRLIPAVGDEDENRAIVFPGEYKGEISIPERFAYTDKAGNTDRYYVKAIRYGAFKGSEITKLAFNSRIKMTDIGASAFADCKKLTEVTISGTVNALGVSMFNGCDNLKTVTLNEGLKEIGISAFNDCKALTSISIPSTVKIIGEDAFAGCTSLTTPDFASIESLCSIEFQNEYANPLWEARHLYINNEEVTDVVIPESITTIGNYAFYYCLALTSVTIPNSVTSIGDAAFYFCRSLTEMTIGGSVQTIGDRAFENCTGLKSVIIPNSVQTIGNGVFKSCSALSKVTIGNSIEGISEDLFSGCGKLYSLKIEDGTKPFNLEIGANLRKILYLVAGRPIIRTGQELTSLLRLTIGNQVEEIEASTFSNCYNLENLKLGSSLTTIGDNAFTGCASLTEVIVPPSVETIGASAFAGGSKLTSIIMGHSVKKIGEKAFDGCPASTISITAQTPPSAPNNTFSNYSGKLYLQGQDAVDAYYDALTCWDRFSSYVMIEPTEMKYEGPSLANAKPGDQIQLKATLMPDNVTLPQVFWRSTNPEIATVDQNGLVTIHVSPSDVLTRAESCKIIAESLYADGPTAEMTIVSENTEVESIELNLTEAEVTEGETVKLTATVKPEDATDKTITWTSSDETVATVAADGTVSALKPGTATITAKTANDLTANCKITVVAKVIAAESIELNLTEAEVTEGETVKLTATVKPDNATDKTVTWTSSDETVATVAADGTVTALKPGTTTITAKTANGLEATCKVTVVAKIIDAEGIELNMTEAKIKEEETVQLTATVLPAEATDKTVMWSSSDAAVATVNANGLVTGVKAGTATITAKTSNGLTATCTITVDKKSGIDGVDDGSQIRVIAREGVIIVEAPEGMEVEVYSIAGLRVARTREHRIEGLTHGVYIVRVGGKSVKVIL